MHRNSDSQKIALFFRLQQKISVLRPSSFDIVIVAIKSSQDVRVEQCFFILYIIIIIKSS